MIKYSAVCEIFGTITFQCEGDLVDGEDIDAVNALKAAVFGACKRIGVEATGFSFHGSGDKLVVQLGYYASPHNHHVTTITFNQEEV